MSAASSWGASLSCRQVIRTTRQPAALRARSRARSRSNAATVPWTARPSNSAIRRAPRQTQSTSTNPVRRAIGAFSSGRGRRRWARNRRKRSSSSLLVSVVPMAPAARIERIAAVPRRRGYRASRAGRERGSVYLWTSASLIARSVARRSKDRGQVQQRPRDRGYRNGGEGGDLIGRQVGHVPRDSRSLASGAQGRDVHVAAPPGSNPPQARRGPMAEHRTGPGGEHGRHPSRLG